MSVSSEEPSSTVRVAVVDDSMFIRKAIVRMLDDEPQIDVVGSAGSGEELLTHLHEWQPDVITLDLDMPGMGGLATLDRVMSRRPTPVIILSTHSGKGAPLTIEALHRGATDFIDKQQYSLVDFEALRAVLIERIFQVTDRKPLAEPESETIVEPPPRRELFLEPEADDSGPAAYDVIVIGASTGGPPTLQRILEDLGESIPVPVVVVQHMPVGFTQAFAERLNAYLPLQVSEAHAMEHLLPDSVYIAPAGAHLRISRHGNDLVAESSTFPRGLPHMPSIDVLFESAANAVGRRVIGALLTGMGRDGAKGMAAVKYRGGYTLCQNEASCVVYGMPRAAMALGAVIEVTAPDVMGRRIQTLVSSGPGPARFAGGGPSG